MSILKEIPAGNAGGAVEPWLLPVERAVSSIPIAFIVVTLAIAHFIPRMLLTLHKGAGRRYSAFSVCSILTVWSRELPRAETAVLPGVGWVFDAGSSIQAGPLTPQIDLTVRATEAWLALAARVAGHVLHTVATVLAMKICTVVVFYFTAVKASKAL